MARAIKSAAVTFTVLAVLFTSLLTAPGIAEAGGGCSWVKAGPRGTAAAIHDKVKDRKGCTVPLRLGNNSFGYRHLVKRNKEVGGHHWSAASRARTQAAIHRAGFARAPAYVVHAYPYVEKTRSGSSYKRTQCVAVHNVNYRYAGKSYGRKGIITSFWVSGHRQPHQC